MNSAHAARADGGDEIVRYGFADHGSPAEIDFKSLLNWVCFLMQ